MKLVVGKNGRNPVKNLPRPRFVHHETHMEGPRRELGTSAVGGERLTACATRPPTKAVMAPIYKKDDQNSYRDITLLSQTFKIYERIIANKLRKKVEIKSEEEQCTFRCERAATDLIFYVRQLIEKTGNLVEIYRIYANTLIKKSTHLILQEQIKKKRL